MRLIYRARQLLAALTARVTEADLAEADDCLPEMARALFRRTPRDAQAHALRVMRHLKRAGHAHPSLLAAALLHDAGKSAARITPLHRSLFVVIRHFAPAILGRLPATETHRPLVALRDHARIGAEWARAAGCDELTVRLIARHPERVNGPALTEEDRLLRALQEVDDRN